MATSTVVIAVVVAASPTWSRIEEYSSWPAVSRISSRQVCSLHGVEGISHTGDISYAVYITLLASPSSS